MKRTILTLALILITLVSFSQITKTVNKEKKQIIYDSPKREYVWIRKVLTYKDTKPVIKSIVVSKDVFGKQTSKVTYKIGKKEIVSEILFLAIRYPKQNFVLGDKGIIMITDKNKTIRKQDVKINDEFVLLHLDKQNYNKNLSDRDIQKLLKGRLKAIRIGLKTDLDIFISEKDAIKYQKYLQVIYNKHN